MWSIEKQADWQIQLCYKLVLKAYIYSGYSVVTMPPHSANSLLYNGENLKLSFLCPSSLYMIVVGAFWVQFIVATLTIIISNKKQWNIFKEKEVTSLG